MTDASIGYGSYFHISQDNGDNWTAIAEVYDITPPSSTVDQIDATHMQSPNRNREFIAGLSDPGSASFEMNFVPGSASDLKIQEIRGTGEQVLCRVTFPNSVTWVFTGQVESYEPAVPTEDRMTASVSFKVSGSTVASAAAAPVNSVLPAISGVAQEDEELTAWEGVWSQAAVFTYQWQEDDSGWANITGATSKTFTPLTAHVGNAIRVTVTATNTAGNASATSVATAVVIGA